MGTATRPNRCDNPPTTWPPARPQCLANLVLAFVASAFVGHGTCARTKVISELHSMTSAHTDTVEVQA